jgi:hypothetical protein
MTATPAPPRAESKAQIEWNHLKQHFLASLGVNAIILIPIILSLRLYLDDHPRALFGTLGWDRDARPAASIFFYLLNLGSPLVAASPLYQIIALIFISITCAIVARAFKIRSALIGALCTLPMIGQPYFLANLSFGFDSASMALAQLLAITAAALIWEFRGKKSFALATMLLVGSLLTYQASASSFLVFSLMLSLASLLEILGDKQKYNFFSPALKSLGCYVISLAIIGVYVRHFWKARSTYASESSKLLDFNLQLPGSILNNATKYLRTYWNDWAHTPLPWLILILGVILIGSQLGSKRNGAWTGPILLLIVLFAPGASLLLAAPPTDLPRTLVFIGPLLSSLSLLVIKSLTQLKLNSKIWTTIGLIPIGLLAWLFILVTFSYAHAAQAQQEFEAGKVSRLIDQINRLNPPFQWREIQGISYSGSVQRAPIVQNSVRKFAVVDRLIFRLIADNNGIGLNIMNIHGLPPLKLMPAAPLDANEMSCTARDGNTVCSSEYIVQFEDGVLRVRFL